MSVQERVCEYCGPRCYGGAEHNQRFESGDRYDRSFAVHPQMGLGVIPVARYPETQELDEVMPRMKVIEWVLLGAGLTTVSCLGGGLVWVLLRAATRVGLWLSGGVN